MTIFTPLEPNHYNIAFSVVASPSGLKPFIYLAPDA